MEKQNTKEKTIQLTVSLTEKEYVEIKLYTGKKKLIIQNIATFIVGWVYFSVVNHLIFSWSTSIFLGLAITIPLIIAIFFRNIRSLKRDFKEDYLIQEESVYELEEMGIRSSQPQGTLFLSGKDFDSINEIPNFFLLYISGLAVVVPKRCFDSLEDMLLLKKRITKYSPHTNISH